jgi:hypothetical protein
MTGPMVRGEGELSVQGGINGNGVMSTDYSPGGACVSEPATAFTATVGLVGTLS